MVRLRFAILVVGLFVAGISAGVAPAMVFECRVLENGDAPITLNVAFQPGAVARHPVILMLGSLQTNRLPDWSTHLVPEGYMLAAFAAAHPPDPDPARRAQWLYFDQRFAHSYVLGAKRAIADSKVVMDYLASRDDVAADKIGWLGSSSTGIPGLAVATQGPRLAAIVAFVSTGAYHQWFDTWRPNGLWRSGTNGLWADTEELLAKYDPVLHVDKMFPTPVLMVSGGEDKVVDPKTARVFVEAAWPFYKSDPERLRLVVYEGFGHNLPADIVRLYAEHWFHLYMAPTTAPPRSAQAPGTLAESVARSQINATDHRQILGVAQPEPARSVERQSVERVRAERDAPRSDAPHALECIKVSSNRRSFVEARSGQAFVPWGFNYDRDYKSRLLEDYWETEWATVVEDFREMKTLGANVVRVHLQFARFMDGPAEANDKALERLTRLLRLAEETGLYLDLTGLACYRKTDVPGWYNALAEPERWNAQAQFWEAVARRCANSPAVFCYDLVNEPLVPAGKRRSGDWLTGELGGFYYCQFVSLDQAGRSRPAIARQWVEKMVAAIRIYDRQHLVTVGLLPNSLENKTSESGFRLEKLAGPLDFICVHIYPRSGRLKQNLMLLRGFNVGKPVVIEETFPLYCKVAELREFLAASKDGAAGWFGFYWGQTPEQLGESAAPSDALTRDWLRLFEEMKPNKAP